MKSLLILGKSSDIEILIGVENISAAEITDDENLIIKKKISKFYKNKYFEQI